jgi:hypothetical protein
MFNNHIEKLSRFSSNRARLRFRRISINRILVNDIDIKHTNSKVLIDLSVFNTEKQFLLKKLKNVKIKNSKFESFSKLRLYKSILKYRKGLLMNNLRQFNNKLKLLKFYYHNQLLVNKYYLNNDNKISTLLDSCINKLMRKNLLKLRYRYLLYLNNSKFNSNMLSRFKLFIERIFGKKVDFNIINIKYPYMSSKLFSNLLSIKIRSRKFNIRKVFRFMFKDLKLPLINKGKSIYNKNYVFIKNTNNKMYLDKIREKISLNLNYFSNLLNNISSNNSNNILNYVNYKYISGIMIKVNGKLSRKVRVSRSQSSIEYKGNIKNIYSQYKHLSTPLNKGYLTSNVQYTNINDKTRMGSYGIKG